MLTAGIKFTAAYLEFGKSPARSRNCGTTRASGSSLVNRLVGDAENRGGAV